MLSGAKKWLVLAVLAGVAFPLSLVLYAHSVNGFHGFPIDDAWIHLQFARVLSQHAEWTYFPGDQSVSGSTSPLYTMAVALGFLFTNDEKVLGHCIGLLFHLGFLAAFAAWAYQRLGKNIAWACGAVLLIALDGRVGILAVSGMETSLFLGVTALALYGRAAKRPLLCGVALGSGIWIRPDGMILLIALGLDLLLERSWSRSHSSDAESDAVQQKPKNLKPSPDSDPDSGHQKPKNLKPSPLGPVVLILVAYGVFNLVVGGSLLPNTFAAKTAYYRVMDTWQFVSGEMFNFLVVNAGWVITPLALVAVAGVAWDLLRRRRAALAGEAAWVVGLLLAYVLFLPFAHRFHRYLVPALPALVVLGLAGLRMLMDGAVARGVVPNERLARVAGWVVLGAALALQVYSSFLREPGFAHKHYAHFCRYHNERHERTGRWLAKNTKPGAVIATHDVGAIAFYSGRKVVDMVGLVEPEVHQHLHSPRYVTFLSKLFAREKVTHLAVLQNWIEVDNVRPIYRPHPEPEILEVFRWQPGRTHICPMEASRMKRTAVMYLKQGKLQKALHALIRVVKADPGSSRSWIFLGQAYEQTFNGPSALQAYSRALQLNPSIPGLGQHVKRLRARVQQRR